MRLSLLRRCKYELFGCKRDGSCMRSGIVLEGSRTLTNYDILAGRAHEYFSKTCTKLRSGKQGEVLVCLLSS